MRPIETLVRHAAELDAFGYFSFLNDRNPEAALRFLSAIDQTVEDLALHPLKGRLRKFSGQDLNLIRSCRVDGFEKLSDILSLRFKSLGNPSDQTWGHAIP